MTIGLAVTAGSVQADSAIINTCPGVISSPGGYLVRADLICGGGDAITITSSDVTLEFEEHRITAGERANRAIVVTNPRLSTFAQRPHLGSRSDHERRSKYFLGRSFPRFCATFRGERDYGAEAGVGIVCGDSTGTITANTLGRNGTGIALADCPLITVSENDISGNGTGIVITACE